MIEAHRPLRYIGTDMREGPGVDLVCTAEDLPLLFGDGYAGVVVTTEMLEHAADWQAAMAGLIRVLACGGTLLLTTRSEGAGYHCAPGLLAVQRRRRCGRSCPAPGLRWSAASPTRRTLACSQKPASPPGGSGRCGRRWPGIPPGSPPSHTAALPEQEGLMGILDYVPGGEFNPQPGTVVQIACPDGDVHQYVVPDSVPMFTDFTCTCGFAVYEHSFA